ncbi:hypothetical protein [uncultured Mucilaginibacter sp.]|uniref:hypothetical protein n=1 Tax=uncultured Mucilaginibacter sp. TaxID=797541 RepID=UPI0025F40488|nr:hypothetical protein [uncultured Mucilaginibacter sp.]
MAHINANLYAYYDKNLCGGCAHVVRLAIEAGGITTNDRNANPRDPTSQYYAKNCWPYLLKKGFIGISEDGYGPVTGDIRVWQNYPGGNIAGHIDMWNGN